MPEPVRNQNNPPRNPNRSQPPRRPSSSPLINGNVIAAVILGVCIIIAGVNIKSSLTKLTAAVTEQTFASNYSSPSTITVNSSAQKQYFTEDEAAAYLNISVDEVKAAIAKGEIEQYINTSTGYSISKTYLDKYFEQKSYEIMVKNSEASQSSDES